MIFDPMSVEVTCVTLPKDHCVQVPWQYINVCGYSNQFCKMTTYYILRTYYLLCTEWVITIWSLTELNSGKTKMPIISYVKKYFNQKSVEVQPWNPSGSNFKWLLFMNYCTLICNGRARGCCHVEFGSTCTSSVKIHSPCYCPLGYYIAYEIRATFPFNLCQKVCWEAGSIHSQSM